MAQVECNISQAEIPQMEFNAMWSALRKLNDLDELTLKENLDAALSIIAKAIGAHEARLLISNRTQGMGFYYRTEKQIPMESPNIGEIDENLTENLMGKKDDRFNQGSIFFFRDRRDCYRLRLRLCVDVSERTFETLHKQFVQMAVTIIESILMRDLLLL